MNKRELVNDVAVRLGRDPSEVAEIVDAVVDTIVRTVATGDRVVIQGFGTFLRRARARRVARDINADRKLVVPATHVPVFHPGKPVREIVARRRRSAGATATGRSRVPSVFRRTTRRRVRAAVR
jgi:DNA-binding protein HU-beta